MRVASVRLTLTEGKGTIAGLSVANPPGFSGTHVFELGEIRTQINIDSVADDPIVIDEIYVGAPEILYEIDKQGRSNIEVLQSNLSSGAPSGPTEPKEAEKPVNLIIRKLVVESGKIDAKIAALPDRDLSVDLPRVELRNLGGPPHGAPPEEIAREVVDILLQRVGTAVVKLGVERYLAKSVEELKRQAQESIEQELGDRLGKGLQEGLGRLRDP